MSERRRQQPPSAFVADSFTPAPSAPRFESADPRDFRFPDLQSRSGRGEEVNPPLLSLDNFVPTSFAAVDDRDGDEGRQNFADVRRRILHQLESYKRRQEDELYQQRLEAEKAAAEQVELARREADGIRRQAEEEGYRDGLARGEEKIAERVADLAEILQQLTALRECLTRKYEQEIISLAVEIARKIVQREISLDSGIILTLAKQAIAEMPHERPMTLKLHPEDCRILEEKLPLFAQEFESLGELQLVPSETVPRGGCLLETPAGRVDAGLESQLAEIRAGLQN